MTGYFNPNFERDLILLSVLTTCSTLFPHVQGRYDRKDVGLNLFLFITARASAGKGAISWAKVLTYKISDYLHEQHLRKYQKYQLDYSEYMANRKKDPDALPPIEPLEPRLLIPANISSAMLVEILNNNKTFGLMFETEADVLVNTAKNEWGDISYLIRAAFHHEPISLARRSKKEYLEVRAPQLSGVFSGTVSSLRSFIIGVENGFFSRFMQYLFNAPVDWLDKFIDDGIDLENIFEEYGNLFLDIWKKYEGATAVKINIQSEQREKFFTYFKTKLSQLHEANGDDIIASVNRHGLIAYRIAMVLTVLRQVSNGAELNKNIFIDDVDFESALQITDVLFRHLEKVFSLLQTSDKSVNLSTIKKRLYDNLPECFTTREYNDIAREQGVNIKTAEKYLGQLLAAGLLERLEHGKYRKK